MNEVADFDVPVLVVEAGPAGRMTSLLLSRYGVRSLLVERHAEVSLLPRAMGINARMMEIFRALDLATDVEAISVDVGDRPLQVAIESLRGPVRETVSRWMARLRPWSRTRSPRTLTPYVPAGGRHKSG